MVPKPENLVKCILSQTTKQVDLIVILESQARGDAMPGSDTDIAVPIPAAAPAERFEARLDIIGKLAGPNRDFDLVMIEDVGWSLSGT